MKVISKKFVDKLRRDLDLPDRTSVTMGTDLRTLIGTGQTEALQEIQNCLGSSMGVQSDVEKWFWSLIDHSETDVNKRFGRPGTVRRLQSLFKRCAENGRPDNSSD